MRADRLAYSTILAGFALGGIGFAAADEPPPTPPAQQPPGPPYTVDGFGITPQIVVAGTYTNNVRENASLVGDFRNDTTADLKIDAPKMTDIKLSLDSIVQQRSYLRYYTDDTTLFSFTGSGEYDFTDSLNFTSNLRYFQNRVSQSDPNAIPGAVQSIVTTKYGNFQLNYDSPTWYDQVVINTQQLRYGAALIPKTDTQISTSNQNRDETDYDNHFGRKFEWMKLKTYLYLDYNEINYASSTDPTVVGRNSHGYKAAFGTEITPDATFDSYVLVGYVRQDYDTASIGTLNGWFGSVVSKWQIDDANGAALNYARTFNETDIQGSPGYFLNTLSLTMQHKFSPSWNIDFMPMVLRADVSKITATLQQVSATLGVNWVLAPGTSIRAAVMQSDQHVNNFEFSSLAYREHTATLQATISF